MPELPTVEIYHGDMQIVIDPHAESMPQGMATDTRVERAKLTPQQWAAIIIAVIQAIAAALGAIPTATAAGKGGQHESPPANA